MHRLPACSLTRWCRTALAAGLCLGLAALAQARQPGVSDASAASLLPVALLVSAPAVLVSGLSQATVVAVEASADGTVWVLQQASDGARFSLRLAGGASVAVGSAVQVTALASGWLISSAGQALALVPNIVGQALLHHERVSR